MKARKKNRHIFLRMSLLAFSVYVVVVLVQLRLQIDKRQAEIDAVKQQVESQLLIKESLEQQTDNLDSYLEQLAREKGYSKSGEVVFTEVPGAN